MIAPAAGAAAAAGTGYSLGLCGMLSGICSAISCAFSALVAGFTGARCCSGGACAGNGKDAWGAGKVGSMLVVVYAVAMSFLFLYGLEDKLHHLAEHAKAWENTSCKLGDDYDAECLGQEGVFRINLAVVAFFASNWLGCKLSKQWHNALWIVKMVFFLGYCAITLFWIPSPFIDDYVWASRVMAALYAVALMVFIIEFAYEVNDWMVDQSGDWGAPTTCGLDDNLIVLLCISFVLFAATLAGIVCLFVFFPKDPDACEAGQAITAFISMTLVFCVACTATQLVFSESGNLLTSSAVCAYGTYLAYTAIAKHPSSECNPFWEHKHDWMTWVSLILAFISLIWMSKTAEDVGNTIDPELGVELVPSDDEEKNEDKSESPPPAPIDCLDGGDRAGATFNLIMALAACYVACTIANWGASTNQGDTMSKPLAGRASMWMQIVAQWAMFLLYEWTLVAPLIFPDRDWV